MISPFVIRTQGDEHKIFEWFAAYLLQMTVVVWCNLSCIFLVSYYSLRFTCIKCTFSACTILYRLVTKRYVIKGNSKSTSHKPIKDTAFVDMKNKVTCYWGISHRQRKYHFYNNHTTSKIFLLALKYGKKIRMITTNL